MPGKLPLPVSFMSRRKVTASIRIYMLALSLITTFPLALFSVLIVGELRDSDAIARQERAAHEAESLSRLIERQFHDMTTTLHLLETSPEVRNRDWKSFHERATAALTRNGWYMLLVDSDGQQLFNTRVPYGESLGKTSNMPALRKALDSGQPVVSDIFLGRTSGQMVYNAMMRVDIESIDDKQHALILTQNASDLGKLVASRSRADNWRYALLDGSDAVVASNTGVKTGDRLPEDILTRAKNMRFQDARHEAASGYTKVGNTDWQVVVWSPESASAGLIGSTWRNLIIAGVAFFMISMFLALLFGWQLQSAIKGLSRQAKGVARGEVVSDLRTGIDEIDQVAKALSEASFERYQAEERTHTVLREMAHRTKNIIHIAQSLVRQTARSSADKDAFVAAITGRLNSFAKSLELLLSDGTSNPTFLELVRLQLETFVETNERFKYEGDDFTLKAEAVKEVGMIIHELATNAVKYGALSSEEGLVTLHCKRISLQGSTWIEMMWQEWSNNTEFVANGPKGFGSTLIQITAQSLGGYSEREFLQGGITWTVRFPEKNVSNGVSA